jgi:hypothetical protein
MVLAALSQQHRHSFLPQRSARDGPHRILYACSFNEQCSVFVRTRTLQIPAAYVQDIKEQIQFILAKDRF